MNASLLKSMLVLAGLVVLSACPGKKSEDKIIPSVGPQGRITAFGSSNTYCDIANGSIMCSTLNPSTGAVCNSATKSYNTQDLNSFCQQMAQLRNESLQLNACNVSDAVNRIISEHCRSLAAQPINSPVPGLPNFRQIKCSITVNESLPMLIYLSAGNVNSSYKQYLYETKSKWKGLLTYPSRIGDVSFNYIPSKGKIPETLTIVGRYRDKVAGRDVLVKHSGFAGSSIKLDAVINGASLSASCNDAGTQSVGAQPLSDVSNLVCTGSSNVTGSGYEENIQFVRPINSMVSGEEVTVTEAVRLSVDKSNSMLTVRTNVDQMLGPDMTSSSSLRADTLVEANEGNGRAKITCSIK